jgi:hypothetical protein
LRDNSACRSESSLLSAISRILLEKLDEQQKIYQHLNVDDFYHFTCFNKANEKTTKQTSPIFRNLYWAGLLINLNFFA